MNTRDQNVGHPADQGLAKIWPAIEASAVSAKIMTALAEHTIDDGDGALIVIEPDALKAIIAAALA